MSQSVFLPNYTIGTDAYEKANGIVKEYGKKVVLIGGKTALSKAENKIKAALTQEIEVIASLWYGGNSTYENIEQLIQHESVQKADVLFAVGGGRACDTVKVIGEKLAKPVFTFPTIGSNCSPVTAVCVIYNEEGVMDGLFFPSKPPVHTFIDTAIIAEAPDKYVFMKKNQLPVSLADMNLNVTTDLEAILDKAMTTNDIKHVPYEITREKFKQAILDVETYHATQESQQGYKKIS